LKNTPVRGADRGVASNCESEEGLRHGQLKGAMAVPPQPGSYDQSRDLARHDRREKISPSVSAGVSGGDEGPEAAPLRLQLTMLICNYPAEPFRTSSPPPRPKPGLNRLNAFPVLLRTKHLDFLLILCPGDNYCSSSSISSVLTRPFNSSSVLILPCQILRNRRNGPRQHALRLE
jgi:hypothetical protein